MRLVTVEEMQAIEAEANKNGITYEEMMQRAGNGLADLIEKYYRTEKSQVALGLVGSGNNGGDTLVALTRLAEKGWRAQAYLAKPRSQDDPLIRSLLDTGGEITSVENDKKLTTLKQWIAGANICIDGILGTGFKLPLKADLAEILTLIRDHAGSCHIVAVDCPSGIDCNTGQCATECIPAEVTVCIEAIKMGLMSFPAYQYVGRLEIVPLGFDDKLKNIQKINTYVATHEWVSSLMPKRPLNAHKGSFGTVMLVTGSINYTGAALLSAKAAYQIGTGLVRVAVPGPLYTALAGNLLEATWLLLPHDAGVISEDAAELILQNVERVDAMLIGPGWGQESTTEMFLNQLLTADKKKVHKAGIGFVMLDDFKDDKIEHLPPLVIDADALKLLAKIPEWEKKTPKNSVLTPHPGEMSVLTGLSIREIQSRRIEIAKEYAKRWGQVVVLKGALTVVAAPDGICDVIAVATPALAKAGTGDVLAGIITGLMGQHLNPFDAAVAGVWIHAQAGLEAAEQIGHPASVLASDVIDCIPLVLTSLG